MEDSIIHSYINLNFLILNKYVKSTEHFLCILLPSRSLCIIFVYFTPKINIVRPNISMAKHNMINKPYTAYSKYQLEFKKNWSYLLKLCYSPVILWTNHLICLYSSKSKKLHSMLSKVILKYYFILFFFTVKTILNNSRTVIFCF
jgi:hypothetical protein